LYRPAVLAKTAATGALVVCNQQELDIIAATSVLLPQAVAMLTVFAPGYSEEHVAVAAAVAAAAAAATAAAAPVLLRTSGCDAPMKEKHSGRNSMLQPAAAACCVAIASAMTRPLILVHMCWLEAIEGVNMHSTLSDSYEHAG
jgi:hypothetical protein